MRSVRPDAQPRKYEFDLRFANPKPVRVRSISWFWLTLAVEPRAARCRRAVVDVAATPATLVESGIPDRARDAARGGGATLMFLRRTTESLEFVSVHGGATLLSVTGGIGSARAGKKFFVELIKSINAAKAARPQAGSSSCATRCGSIIGCASWAC